MDKTRIKQKLIELEDKILELNLPEINDDTCQELQQRAPKWNSNEALQFALLKIQATLHNFDEMEFERLYRVLGFVEAVLWVEDVT